jgi:hypothetical protein
VTTPDTLESIQFYYLTVYRANGGSHLVAVVDVLRGALQIVKYLSITSSPATIALGMTGTNSNTNINLYSMDGTSYLQQNPTTAVTPAASANTS